MRKIKKLTLDKSEQDLLSNDDMEKIAASGIGVYVFRCYCIYEGYSKYANVKAVSQAAAQAGVLRYRNACYGYISASCSCLSTMSGFPCLLRLKTQVYNAFHQTCSLSFTN